MIPNRVSKWMLVRKWTFKARTAIQGLCEFGDQNKIHYIILIIHHPKKCLFLSKTQFLPEGLLCSRDIGWVKENDV